MAPRVSLPQANCAEQLETEREHTECTWGVEGTRMRERAYMGGWRRGTDRQRASVQGGGCADGGVRGGRGR